MELRFETPATPQQYEQWATVMERVTGDVYGVDEIEHFIAMDTESAWLLALAGDEAVGCGVGRPSSIQSSLYAMARVLPEHRRQGVGTRIYEGLSRHARGIGRGSLWGRVREDDAESRSFLRNRGFREAGRVPFWVNCGMYVLGPEALSRFPERGDHESTTFPELAAEGALRAFRHEGLWLTVNTPKDLRRAEEHVAAHPEWLAA